ncbi:MAG: cytochrome b/b6 domain-containing protein [Acidobacteriota bacterium]
MNTASAFPADSPSASPSRRLVDAPTRVFHWLLALCFVGAYATAEGERWRLVHMTLGYTMIGLVGFRAVWLLVGPRPSRWTAWGARFRALRNAVQAMKSGQFKWPALQTGFNTLAIVSLLAVVVATTASGYVLDQEWLGDWFEEVHEFAGNALLGLVLAHIGLVMAGLLLKSSNPLRLMLTGRAPGRGPDLVERNRLWLGALLMAAVLGFWWTQWQSAPAPTGGGEQVTQGAARPDGVGAGAGRHRRHHDDRDDD